MDNMLTLGFAPIGKVLFSHEDALKQKRIIQRKLNEQNVRYVDLDHVLPDSGGLIREQNHVEAAADFFNKKKIDALFMPHCNFGTEGAAGALAKAMGVPVLLWGPRDDAALQDGTRLRDTLCGMLASSKVMRKLIGNKYTYIENCRTDDAEFEIGLDIFLRASNVVKAVRNMRIGLIGARIDFFWSCIVNESELLERFGIETMPFEIGSIIKRVQRKIEKNEQEFLRRLEELKGTWLDAGSISDAQLIKGVAMRDVLCEIKQEYNLSAIAVQSFFSLDEALESGAALYPMLASEDIILSNESDIHGAISSVMLNAAKKVNEPVFFPEYVMRHPEDDNSVCLWHTGAPASLRHPECKKITIMAPWILPGDRPTQAQMRLKNGPLTVCRFDGETGDYRLGVGQGEIVDGPYTRDYYGWLKVDNWKRWERQLIEGPYIHHCSAAYGHCSDALVEACKYLDIDFEILGK